MKEETKHRVNSAIHGLMYEAEKIDKALIGEKRYLDAQKSEHRGPFALALNRVAEIADGAPVQDIEAARADMLFLFGMLHHLRGGFYSAMWEVISIAHEILADMITQREATRLMGEYADWLDLDTRLGNVHPFEETDGKFRAYDATFLGKPPSEIRYARYEVESRKRLYEGVMGTGSRGE